MRVGFVGTGTMGFSMAWRILGEGFEVAVHDAQREATRPLEERGARWAESTMELASSCDVVLASLPRPQDVEEVVFGEGGLLAGATAVSTFVDLTTNSVGTVRKVASALEARGVDFLDAPVSISSGPWKPHSGTLTLMVGGKKEVLDRVRPVLDTFATRVFHVGGVGTGTAIKLLNNMLACANMLTAMEGMVLATKMQLDPRVVLEVLRESSGGSAMLGNIFPARIFLGNFDPGFAINLMHKDIGLALELGRDTDVPLQMAALAYQRLVEARARGLGGRDVSGLILPMEETQGVTVRVQEATQPAG